MNALSYMTRGFLGGTAPPPPPSTWAGIGATLSVSSSGVVTGNPILRLPAGNAYGLLITGVPYVVASLSTATLTVFSPTGTTVLSLTGTLIADGSGASGYSVQFWFTSADTAALAPGLYPYTVDIAAGANSDELVRSVLLLTAP